MVVACFPHLGCLGHLRLLVFDSLLCHQAVDDEVSRLCSPVGVDCVLTVPLNRISFVSGVLYFGWTLVMSFLFALLSGTIGFVATFIFVTVIFGAIKVD